MTAEEEKFLTLSFTTKDHFTVVCLVSRPLNESEVKVDLVLLETALLYLCS